MVKFFRRTFSKNRRYYRLFHRMLGVTPSDVELYKMALIHRSASVRLSGGDVVNNERLEFLGDAILDAICSEMLFVQFPQMDEGDMTKLRSRMVNRDTLNMIACGLGVDREVVTVQRGDNYKQVGDALEALVGALYLDKGYDRTSRVVSRVLMRYIDIEELYEQEQDFKSRAIEWAQKRRESVEFVTVKSTEFTDIKPLFDSELVIGGDVVGRGSGRTKKQSEQVAAADFFDNIDEDNNDIE